MNILALEQKACLRKFLLTVWTDSHSFLKFLLVFQLPNGIVFNLNIKNNNKITKWKSTTSYKINVTFTVFKNTTESRFSIYRCFKLVILTCYINIKERKGIILLNFRCKFMHLFCLFMQSTKRWRCSLDEKRIKISSTYLLYTIGLKWDGQLSNHSFS